jgi:hypothetical protein
VSHLQITWRIRVVAALVLAALLRSSNGGSELWTSTIPDVLGFGALTTIVVMIVSSRRRASRTA